MLWVQWIFTPIDSLCLSQYALYKCFRHRPIFVEITGTNYTALLTHLTPGVGVRTSLADSKQLCLIQVPACKSCVPTLRSHWCLYFLLSPGFEPVKGFLFKNALKLSVDILLAAAELRVWPFHWRGSLCKQRSVMNPVLKWDLFN